VWVLAAGGLVLAVITILYVIMDIGICPPTDSEHHLHRAQYFARTFHLFGFAALWDLVRNSYVGWPPASYALLYGPLAWLLGEESQTVRLCGLALVPIFLWGTYRLGRELGDKRTGALAALLTIFSFGISGQLRQVSIDLPAAAAVLLAMVALMRARDFTRLRANLILGAAVGLCLLTRVQSALFIFGPLMIKALAALWRAPDHSARIRRIGAMGLALALAALVSSPWWFGRLDTIWQVLTSHLDPQKIHPRGDPRFYGGLVHFGAALGKLAGWPALFFALCTLPFLVGRRWRTHGLLNILALWLLVLGGVAGLSAGVHREPRYLLPAVPALALLAAFGVRALRPRLGSVLGALLLFATVAPTLILAASPLAHSNILVRLGVMEWAYTRLPVHPGQESGARQAALLLARALDMEHGGRGIYLLTVPDPRVSYLSHLGNHLLPMLPNLAVCSTANLRVANLGWHLRERGRRKIMVISEMNRTLKLPLVRTLPSQRLGNSAPIRLYEVPAGHPLHGIIRPWLLNQLR